jgi:hypothetical protein
MMVQHVDQVLIVLMRVEGNLILSPANQEGPQQAVLPIMMPKLNLRTQMETLSPEQILAVWQRLDRAEQHRLVVEHLRETLSSHPPYAEKVTDPDYFERLSSSCARMIPYTWVARFGTSCTAADLYAIRKAQEQLEEGVSAT